ncbi:MAG: MoxR family ATPase [Planctomycetota bacterium]
MSNIEAAAENFRRSFSKLCAEIGKVIVGHERVVEGVLGALVVGGHVLLEGVPGLGKTMLVRTLAEALELSFSRIQFTPDLMPADIVGTNIVMEDERGGRSFRFERGPIFGCIVLADEINRATPKTQSALLEAMQEVSVTVGNVTYRLEEPFLVLATQNPLEMEGTYPLPEAQLDRFFFKLKVAYPSAGEMHTILERTTAAEDVHAEKVADGATILGMRALVRSVPIATHVRDYAVRLVMASHPDNPEAPEKVRRYVRYGASPRGAQAMVLAGKVHALLAGRFHVSCEDVRIAALPALRHRLILNFEGEAEGIDADEVISAIAEAITELAGAKPETQGRRLA